MLRTIALGSLLGGLLMTATAVAQAPAGAPAGATGQCKDGSYWTNPTKKGACKGHKGVQTWYAAAGTAASPSAAPATPAPTTAAAAPTPGPAPAGATGLCKDGTYWTNPTKSGACRGHKGIQSWYAAAGTAASPPATPAASAAPAPVPTAVVPTPATPTAKKSAAVPATTAAAGGGPGLVWVNTPSHVYHCSTDRWYGKTKTGAYMTEAAAKAEGDHADHGKACQ